MTRVAAVLIVLGVLIFNGGLGRPALAETLAVRGTAGVEVAQPLAIRSGRILSLILTLEALRQVPVPVAPQKG
jgi:hypothetical protein